jgi:hypothetical protein
VKTLVRSISAYGELLCLRLPPALSSGLSFACGVLP